MSELNLEDTREEKAKRWKFSKVIWLVLYLLLFIFVLLHFGLSPFSSVSGRILSPMVSLFEKERVSLDPSHLGDPESTSCIVYMVYNFLSFFHSRFRKFCPDQYGLRDRGKRSYFTKRLFIWGI